MTKNLYLVRHAQAELTTAMLKDFDRELNTTGYADASRMGKYFAEQKLRFDLIYSSPAHRTQTTAQLIAEQIGFETDAIVLDFDIYDTSLRSLLRIINQLEDDKAHVMIVGHNPHLTYLAEYLTHQEVGPIPTCGVVNIAFDVPSWSAIAGETGKVVWFEYPEKITQSE